MRGILVASFVIFILIGVIVSQTGVYKQHNPKQSIFYQVISRYYGEFLDVYDEMFQGSYGYLRPVIPEVIDKYLDCGDLAYGFARVRCQACSAEYLLAFSCKTRYFCPSCHQKRVLALGELLREKVLQRVGHRQIVFTVPKMLRCYFRYDRKLLGKLSRCAYDTVRELYSVSCYGSAALTAGGPDDTMPGVVIAIQTFGDLANYHPHLHALATEGCFNRDGIFYPVPKISTLRISELFTHKALKMLLEEGKITEDTVKKIMSWRYTGFSIDNSVYIGSDERDALEGLVQYITRAPVSAGKVIMNGAGDKVIYRSKLNPRIGRNFQVFEPVEWIAALTCHIPNKGEHMTRYYGFYSNASRGKRKKNGVVAECRIASEGEELLSSKEYRTMWAQLIRKVYEVDPLICPECGEEMRIVGIITERPVIDKILVHLDLIEKKSHSPPAETVKHLELTSEPCYDDLPFDEND